MVTDEMVKAAVEAVSDEIDWVEALFGGVFDSAEQVMRAAIEAALSAAELQPAPSVAVKAKLIAELRGMAGSITYAEEPSRVMREAAAALSAQVQDVAGWQSMDTAPKDGSEFAAGRRYSPDGEFVVHSYRWVGAPNYWLSKRNGVCIRPSYQADYKWCPLPAAPAKQEG